MKKILISALSVALTYNIAAADDTKIGVFLGYTGPIESLTPDMAAAAEAAIAEVNAAGNFFNNSTIVPVRADTTCVDAAAATAAAERLVTAEGVAGLVGGDCSGVTIATLTNVALPNGVVMISPSATSPALSTTEDNGLFFRTAPSDARQGQVMTDIIRDRNIASVALTYTNNDYGKGLADAFQSAFEQAGGKVTVSVPHEDGKGDYGAEVAALSAAGGDVLVVAGYLDQGGKGIIEASLDTDAFDTFVLPDGMIGDSLPQAIGADLNGSFGQVPGTDSPGSTKFIDMAAGFNGQGPFAAESYDAAALIMLAMQATKSTNSQDYKNAVIEVANAPGTKIYPGELGKALAIIADGGDVDYVGASNVELIGAGESAGNYREVEIQDGGIATVGYR